ncbi:MAG: U32 family peptidase, partial [Candidatus Eremiobacteraeota bacterium]|nr:U32 family peptidase [Candidatus Eremiobacteraeota bacterium]
LERLEPILARIAKSGVDALIVQDPAVALLARAICPEMELHASTQMTISSPEAATFAAELGVTRVVVPRELSVEEIARFRQACQLELEVFIMGALCVSWSGQCLSSETWGGRSANRGQCAQACRLPYELVVDGQTRPLGEISYLLSPRDLAGFRAVERLMEIGIHTLKIEGRQKGPEYVKMAVSSLRDWLDALADRRPDPKKLAADVRDLSLTYSRGFSDGFLFGSDHQTLVDGVSPRHRGIFLGVVEGVEEREVVVRPAQPQPDQAQGQLACTPPALGGSTVAASGAAPARLIPRPGMGVVFCQGDEQEREQGGPIFSVARAGSNWRLGFGQPGPDLSAVRPGARVHVTSDPRAARGRQGSARGQDLNLVVSGQAGGPLLVEAGLGSRRARAQSQTSLAPSTGGGLDQQTLVDKLGALGGTSFRLNRLENKLEPGLFLPVSELKKIRRQLVDQLEAQLQPAVRVCRPGPHVEILRQTVRPHPGPAYLVALCRQPEHLEAAIASGIERVELDWMEMVGLNAAVERARQAGLEVGLAT